MFKELIRQLFSGGSRLTSLRLDIVCNNSYVDLQQCLKPCNKLSSCSIFDKYQSYCMTLRRLHIHLQYTCFFEHLIEYVPALEQLSVYFRHSLNIWRRPLLDIDALIQTNGNWFNKVTLETTLVLQLMITSPYIGMMNFFHSFVLLIAFHILSIL